MDTPTGPVDGIMALRVLREAWLRPIMRQSSWTTRIGTILAQITGRFSLCAQTFSIVDMTGLLPH